MMVNVDRAAIITMLNLHLLLQDYQLKQQNQFKNKNENTGKQYHRDKNLHTFTICEVVHESNIIFLRDQIQTADCSLLDKDWPLLCSGSVMSHTLLDALMVQSVFTPDILSFW